MSLQLLRFPESCGDCSSLAGFDVDTRNEVKGYAMILKRHFIPVKLEESRVCGFDPLRHPAKRPANKAIRLPINAIILNHVSLCRRKDAVNLKVPKQRSADHKSGQFTLTINAQSIAVYH
jgi:hypothetical protein